MNEIKDCIDALLAAVQNSEEYQEFMKYKALVEQDPGLMERVMLFGPTISDYRMKQTETSCSG